MNRLLFLGVALAFFLKASAQTEEAGAHRKAFFMLGAGVGAPSGISLICGYDFGPLALRVSGGGWQNGWFGAQGDLAIHFNRARSFAHGLSIIGGRYGANPVNAQREREEKTSTYIGGAYDVYLAGFFFQAGLAFGKGNYPGLDAVYQFGYLFEF